MPHEIRPVDRRRAAASMTCNPRPAPRGRWLLARLWGLFRPGLPGMDPAALTPHLLRDLGLADEGFARGANARLIDRPTLQSRRWSARQP
jgi:hypothetical protein